MDMISGKEENPNPNLNLNCPENDTQTSNDPIAAGAAIEGPDDNPIINADVTVYVKDASVQDEPVVIQGEVYNEPIRAKTFVKCIVLAVVCSVSLALTVVILSVSGVFTKTNTTNRSDLMYSLAVELSGKDFLNDSESPQSRALKWMQNDDQVHISMNLRGRLNQRYASAVIHFSFENTVYMDATKHECDWNAVGIVDDPCVANPIYLRGFHCQDNSSISDIALYDFNLTGTIATEIGYMQDLITLNIGSNPYMRGTIPTEIGKLSHLKNLLIADNDLQGTIPTEIKNIDLEVVLLYHNEDLSGDLSPFCTDSNTLRFLSTDCGNGTSKPVYECVDYCCRQDMEQCCSVSNPESCYTTHMTGGCF